MELKMYSALAAKYTARSSDNEVSHSPSHTSKSPLHGDTEMCMDEHVSYAIDITENPKVATEDTKRHCSSPVLSRSPKRLKEDKSKTQHVTEIISSVSPIILIEDAFKSSCETRRPVKIERLENKGPSTTIKGEVTVLNTDNTHKDARPTGSPKLEIRRLRSHKSSPPAEVSEETVEPIAVSEIPCEKPREPTPEKYDTVQSPDPAAVSSADSILGPVLELGSAAVKLNEKITNWRIIPEEGCGFYPCKIYGATHLARLFVKLPDFLNATRMDEQKLKSLLPRLQIFTDYLEDHPEWFGEINYFEQASVQPEQSVETAAADS